MSLPLPVMGCELAGFGSRVTGWVFVRLSGWLAVVCRVVRGGRGGSGWILVDLVVVGGGFRRLFILNK
jgi:hypothetical protein